MANPAVIRRSGYFENDSASVGTTFTVLLIYVPGLGLGAADAAFNLYVTACMRTDVGDVGNYRTYQVQYRMTGGQIHSLVSHELYEDADVFDPRPLLFGFITYEMTIAFQTTSGFNHVITEVWGVAIE